VRLEFVSSRFDHSSELPLEVNAGNRFYGQDVAEFVRAGLSGRGYDASFLDEDWGWQVHGGRSDGGVLEVSIYHNPDEDPADADRWALLVRLLRKERALGVFSRFREIPVTPAALETLEDIFGESGIALGRVASS